MKGLTLDGIVRAINGELLCGWVDGFTGVSIDSRTIKDGELFFAIRGERFDGHDFLDEALKRGGGAIVDRPPHPLPKNRVIIMVKDTVAALQALAHFRRKVLMPKVIAVTGSNGKTTTKEMAYTVLSKRFRAARNEGNLNNHIGLPLSLLRIEPDAEVVVLELGMNAKGEIRRLCEIALPEYGVITNIGMAHVGMLGGKESIRDAKLEILNGLNTLIINADDRFLLDGVRDFRGRLITFSINNVSDVMAHDIRKTEEGISFRLQWKDKESRVALNLYGGFNIYNALAASSIGFSLGMDIEEIAEALSSYQTFPMRFEVTRKNGLTLINDSYNANPSSMRDAIHEVVSLRRGRRVVVILGDMYELGDFSYDAHREIGEEIVNRGVDVFVAVGEMMSTVAEEIMKARQKVDVYRFKDVYEAERCISDLIRPDDTILIKGSRAMCMERLVKRIKDAL